MYLIVFKFKNSFVNEEKYKFITYYNPYNKHFNF